MSRNVREPTRIVSCPTCKRSVPWTEDNKFRPFCSHRCQLIDLGAWAEGAHTIPGDSQYGDDGDGEGESPDDR